LVQAVQQRCTHANRGRFCVSGNKIGADFLLGHYGRVGAIDWNPPGGDGGARFGSPGSYLRRYEGSARVPFQYNDSEANSREAWRWIGAHPAEAAVLSLDHIYDLFFGSGMWPGYGHPTWVWTHLSQYIFLAFLFVPLVPICAGILRRGWRTALTSRTAMLLAHIAALTLTVAYATGEVRYRIPFDIFFIVTACALVTRPRQSRTLSSELSHICAVAGSLVATRIAPSRLYSALVIRGQQQGATTSRAEAIRADSAMKARSRTTGRR